jgi:hypothetical protein
MKMTVMTLHVVPVALVLIWVSCHTNVHVILDTWAAVWTWHVASTTTTIASTLSVELEVLVLTVVSCLSLAYAIVDTREVV